MGYKEQAEKFKADLEANDAAEAAAKKLRLHTIARDKVTQIDRQNHETERHLRLLDTLGIVDMLEGINKDIWEGVGQIETYDTYDKNHEVITGRSLYLIASESRGHIESKSIWRKAYGKHTVTRMGIDGNYDSSETGWFDQKIGEKKVKVSIFVTPHVLQVYLEANQKGPQGIRVMDNRFNLDHVSIGETEFEKTHDPYPTQRDFPFLFYVDHWISYPENDRFSQIGLSFGTGSESKSQELRITNNEFELAIQLINQGLLSHSYQRLKDPIAARIQRSQDEINTLYSHAGQVTYHEDVVDPTPIWKRVLNPATEFVK